MRVALITFCPANGSGVEEKIKALVAATTGVGHQVDVFNGYQDMVNTRLTMYDYIAVVFKPTGLFGGKLPGRVGEFLAASGNTSGKKACALVLKSGFSAEKACRNLMRTMEAEGMKLDYFEIIRDVDHARYVGKKIG